VKTAQEIISCLLPPLEEHSSCCLRKAKSILIPHTPVTICSRGCNTTQTQTSGSAYRAAPQPHLGSADHLSVMLKPVYRPQLTRVKPTVRQVRVWPGGAIGAHQNCFEQTDLDMFKAAATNSQHTIVEVYAAYVSAYIQKCIEDLCFTKYISSRANEKPQIMQKVSEKPKARNTAFKSNVEAAFF